MLRIHQLFFLNTLGLFIAALIISSTVSYFALKSMTIEESEHRLIETLTLMEPSISQSQNFDELAAFIHTNSRYRFTIIDEDGVVIAESSADKKEMENHLNRPEVMGSMNGEFGVSIRYSNTIKTDFIYVAKRMNLHGRNVYVRIAADLKGTLNHFYRLWYKLLLSFGALTLIALLIAYNISKKARYDILQITQYLDDVAAKNYRAPLKPLYFREFLQISLLLKNLVKKLHNRDKQKRKHTAKLRLINKQQNDILSAISHEFKNPIAAVMGYAETLRDDPKIDLKIRDKFLEKILSNTRKVTLMLDRLALSVKLENNDLQVKPIHFDLADECNDALSALQAKYPNRKIILSAVSRMVYADKTMLDLVITNLLDNALKYSEDEVILSLDENTLKVRDRGIGISSSELENITNKFYRVQKNRWDNSMGLGLSIVSYILKLHNTSLSITSVPKEGSTFSFSLQALHEPPKKIKK